MKLLKALLFVFIAFSSFAQKNYTAGFIILKNQSDTLKGLIDDQNWAINPTKISFINAENHEKSYKINELKAFGIKDKENYLIAKVDLDVTPVSKRELLYGRNLLIKKDTLLAFLVLLKADYSLLHVRDSKDKNHFFYTDGNKIIELINHFFLEVESGSTYELNNKSYQKQLEALFNLCEKKIDTDRIAYQTDELTEKFVEFSECIGCSYTCYFKKKKDKAVITFGVMAGATSDKSYFSHLSYSGSSTSNFDPEIKVPNILLGVNTSISSKRNHNRNSLIVEAYVTQERVRSGQSDFSKDIYYLNISPRLRHQFSVSRAINPFIGAGFKGKQIVSYPGKTTMFGNKLNIFYVGEAGIKWHDFLLSASVNVNTADYRIIENLSIYYNVGANTVQDQLRPQKVNFQASITYLLYNSANKVKAK